MGDGFKADKGPGGEYHYLKDLKQGALAVWRKIRGLNGYPAVLTDDRYEAYYYPKEEDYRHEGHGPGCEALPCDADEAEYHDNGYGKQDLSKIDIVALDRIKIAFLKDSGKDIAADQREGRRVRPAYRDVDKEHEPGGKEAVVVAEDL